MYSSDEQTMTIQVGHTALMENVICSISGQAITYTVLSSSNSELEFTLNENIVTAPDDIDSWTSSSTVVV